MTFLTRMAQKYPNGELAAAAQAIEDGRIAEFESEADAHDPQPTLAERFWAWFLREGEA